MKKSASISVVIPAYNAAGTIRHAIQSIFDQTHPVDEIIVVDDGSVDGTADIIKRQFPSVKLIEQPNTGPSAARNAGIAVACGRYLAFLDADDYWLPWKLARQLAVFAMDETVALVASRAFFLPKGRIPSPAPKDEDAGFEMISFPALLRDNMLLTSSVVVKGEILRNLGGFDQNLQGSEDYDLWLRIARDHTIIRMKSRLVVYHVDSSSLSHDFRRMTLGELDVLAKWEPKAVTGAEGRAAITRHYYQSVLQRWQLKHALRFLSAGDRAGGRRHLLAALKHVPRLPHLSAVALLGLVSPRAFIAIGSWARERSHQALGNGSERRPEQ